MFSFPPLIHYARTIKVVESNFLESNLLGIELTWNLTCLEFELLGILITWNLTCLEFNFNFLGI